MKTAGKLTENNKQKYFRHHWESRGEKLKIFLCYQQEKWFSESFLILRCFFFYYVQSQDSRLKQMFQDVSRNLHKSRRCIVRVSIFYDVANVFPPLSLRASMTFSSSIWSISSPMTLFSLYFFKVFCLEIFVLRS